MRIWIATLTLIYLGMSCDAQIGDQAFLERFALASSEQRQRLLDELVAGTEEYSYFHCLHYQNTRNIAALDQALSDWREQHPRLSAERRQIELREAIFRYPDDHQRSLDSLADHLGLRWEDAPVPGGAPGRSDFATALDPQSISAAAFLSEAARHEDGGGFIGRAAAEWLIASGAAIPEKLDLRWLLNKIDRPDIPNLLNAIRTDMESEGATGFGQLDLHQQLLLPQLDTLLERDPRLLANRLFATTYLRKLRPSALEPAYGQDIRDVREAYLKRAWAFAEALPQSMGAIKAHLLRHWLKLQLERAGTVDQGRFLAYLGLARQVSYANTEHFNKGAERFALGLDLRKVTGLEKLPADDGALVRRLFLTLFQNEGVADSGRYERFVQASWLQPIVAEALALSGEGDPEEIFSILEPAAYQALAQRVDIDLAPENPRRLAAGDPVRLEVDVKNVPKLTVKIFELNALNYFRETGRDLDVAVDLDGLVAEDELSHTYDDPPIRRVRRTFEFPQLADRRGAWIIEFVGNGKSSRALIRKGELHAVPRNTSAGHAFKVFDAKRQLVEGASLWIGGHEFLAEEGSGDVLVPYSTTPRRTPVIVADGEIATLDHFEHLGEAYQLEAGIFVDRESLIAGNAAELVVRPGLLVNGMATDLGLLQEVVMTLTSISHEGTRSVERIQGIELGASEAFVHTFIVPDRLSSLEVRIDAEIESVSTQRRVPLTSGRTFRVNGIDSTAAIGSLQLLQSGEEYDVTLLGKNGEPLPGRKVEIEIHHRLFDAPVTAHLRTDVQGKIALGRLPEITGVIAKTDSHEQIWDFPSLTATDFSGPLQIAAGEPAWHALDASTPELKPENYSLLEVRAGTYSRDWFSALSVDDGALKISGLPAGEYRLKIGDWSTQVFVAADRSGEVPANILATDESFLEHRGGQRPLGIALAAGEGDDAKLRIQVKHSSPETRVHVVASHYHPEFSLHLLLANPHRRAPLRHPIDRPVNTYNSGRAIGDEHRYILERRDQPRFPGNQLQRPGLLLTPWSLNESDSSGLGVGDAAGFGGRGRPHSAPPAGKRNGRGGVQVSDVFSNLDFLPEGQRTFYNLKPDASGVIELDIKQLGSARFLRVLAIDGGRGTSINHALPAVRPELRDRRLSSFEQLDPKARFTLVQSAEILEAGAGRTLPHANSARYQLVDELSDAFALLNAIGGDEILAGFSFVLDWPDLDQDAKRSYYSEYACHELNLFLSQHDEAFFTSAVAPYLRNKREKTFIDHYLLGEDLSGYLEEWRLRHLNYAERALLSRRLEGEAAKQTRQSLAEIVASRPPDRRRREHLFESALASHDLTRGDETGGFRRAMKALERSGETGGGYSPIRAKLRNTIIPNIDFDEVSIGEAVEFLRRRAGGLNILVRQDARGDGETTPPNTPITLQLSNVPLGEALKFTTELAGLKYKIGRRAIEIVPAYEADGQMVVQSYPVPPDMLQLHNQRPQDTKEFLQQVGITFPEEAAATYLPTTSELVMRNTQQNQALLRSLMESLGAGLGETSDHAPSDDPFAAGPATTPMAATGVSDDPFGGGGGDGFTGLQRRAATRQFYRAPDDSQELAENQYYHIPIARLNAALIPANAFWRDYASWDGRGGFLSANLPEAGSSFAEIMLALAVLDLPLESQKPKISGRGNELTITPAGHSIVFLEEISEAALGEAKLVIGQKYYPLDQATRLEGGREVPNYIDEGFVIGTGYGATTIVTNPTGSPIEFDLLQQIPHGAIPLDHSLKTTSRAQRVEPYRTEIFRAAFYFPMAGKFSQYPSQASRDGLVTATTKAAQFVVTKEPGAIDARSWHDLAERGSNAAVLDFLRAENLHLYTIGEITPRLLDKEFFNAVIGILRSRQIYHHQIYAYGLRHDHQHAVQQYLMNSSGFLQEIGATIESELLSLAPADRQLYQHLEYEPLVNARAHPIGDAPRITNPDLQTQFSRLARLLIHRSSPSDGDRLSVVYYLLLQGRIDEAIGFFEAIEPGQLVEQIQYDYFRCYIAFYREQPESARKIALGYRDHPVERWRKRFAQVASQADGIAGRADVAVDDLRDRDQQQASLADSSSQLSIEIEGREISVRHRNLEEATINFYKMDLEFLFSANPFVDGDHTRFRFIRPHLSRGIELAADGGVEKVQLPAALEGENLLIEVAGGGLIRSRAYFANQLQVTWASGYGRLQVRHAKTGKPLAKAYIKAYARMPGGEIEFFKDGYSDLRGKFDYSSISAKEPDVDAVERFAILVMHEEFGALVTEVDPPARRPLRPTPVPAKASPERLPTDDEDPF